MNAPTYDQLTAMTREELIEKYNLTTRNTTVHLNFYREELWRRDVDKAQHTATTAAETTKRLTSIILALTLANVALVAVQVALSA